MTLIDTSSWIEALRQDGDQAVRGRVQSLRQTGDASWCDLVRVELWHGVRGAAERKMGMIRTWAKPSRLTRRQRQRGRRSRLVLSYPK